MSVGGNDFPSGEAVPGDAGTRKSLRDALAEAVAAHRAGRLDDAERIYRAILETKPEHFDALHMLGVARLQKRRFTEARRLIEAALAIDPRSADAHCHLGNVLGALGENEKAIESYERALAIKAKHVNASARS